MAKELLQDHESIVKSLRTSIDDCEENMKTKELQIFNRVDARP